MCWWATTFALAPGGQATSPCCKRRARGAGLTWRACRPYAISGHVVHGRKLGRALAESAPGRQDGFRTLNLRFSRRACAWQPAASGIFAVRVSGLGSAPLPGVANLGVRPSLDAHDINGGRVLLETHVFDWPASLGPEGGYGKIICVELIWKLHEEKRYHSLAALAEGIARDGAQARAWFERHPAAAAAAHPATGRI